MTQFISSLISHQEESGRAEEGEGHLLDHVIKMERASESQGPPSGYQGPLLAFIRHVGVIDDWY